MKDRGLSTTIGALLVFTALMSLYVVYQTVYVPDVCKSYESKHFNELIREAVKFVEREWFVASSGKPTNFYFYLGGNYPTIPFFYTPSGFSGSIYSLNESKFVVENVTGWGPDAWFDPDGPLEYNTTTIVLKPDYMFSTAGEIVIENGIVALRSGNRFVYITGTIVTNDSIRLIAYNGSVQAQTTLSQPVPMYPISGGGDGILITSSGGNLTLKLKTTIDDATFWTKYKEYIFPGALNVTLRGDTVIVDLGRGKVFKLIVGIVGSNCRKLHPNYLINLTAQTQRHVGALSVKTVDMFGNPTRGTVNFCYLDNWVSGTNPNNISVYLIESNGGTIRLIPWNVNEVISRNTNSDGTASVTAYIEDGHDSAYVALFNASIVRPDGTRYEVVFLVEGSN